MSSIRWPKPVHDEVRAYATHRGVTMTSLFVEALGDVTADAAGAVATAATVAVAHGPGPVRPIAPEHRAEWTAAERAIHRRYGEVVPLGPVVRGVIVAGVRANRY